MVARVVHKPEMIFKLRVKADDQHIFHKRDWIRIHEITAREGADAPDSLDKLRPQSCQIG